MHPSDRKLMIVAVVANVLVIVFPGVWMMADAFVTDGPIGEALALIGQSLAGMGGVVFLCFGVVNLICLHLAGSKRHSLKQQAIGYGFLSSCFLFLSGFAIATVVSHLFPMLLSMGLSYITLRALVRMRSALSPPGLCPHCGYDMKGCPTTLCPECGGDSNDAKAT